MMKFKIDPSVAYTDTDSVFTTDLTPFLDVISNELGDFKDEMNGVMIQEGVFLGIKQYGYWYFNKEGVRVVKTVYAGVKRDSLTFEQILELKDNKEITVKNDNRFFKSLNNLNIQIKSTVTNIKQNNDKTLVGNEYLPKNINLLKTKNSIIKTLGLTLLKGLTKLVKKNKRYLISIKTLL